MTNMLDAVQRRRCPPGNYRCVPTDNGKRVYYGSSTACSRDPFVTQQGIRLPQRYYNPGWPDGFWTPLTPSLKVDFDLTNAQVDS